MATNLRWLIENNVPAFDLSGVANDWDCSSSTSLATNRGFLYGDGFFTTIAVRRDLDRSGCLKPEFLAEHMARLKSSASALKFPKINTEQLQSELTQLLSRDVSGIEGLIVRLTLWRAQDSRGYAPDSQAQIQMHVAINPLPPARASLKVTTSEFELAGNCGLAPIKHLNRLPQVMASVDLPPDQERLMLWQQGWICGTRSNLFYAIGEQWYTPPIENAGVNGILRQQLQKAGREVGITISEKPLFSHDLPQVQAAIMTNSVMKAVPVSSMDARPLDKSMAKRFVCQELGRGDLWTPTA